MRKQIQETAEHRADTEKRIMEHNLEIRRLEEGERSLSRNFENRAKPLAVSEARYNLRRRRSTREDCHDEVEDALLREVMELQAGVADMQVGGPKCTRTHTPSSVHACVPSPSPVSASWRFSGSHVAPGALSHSSRCALLLSISLTLSPSPLRAEGRRGRSVCVLGGGGYDRAREAWDD